MLLKEMTDTCAQIRFNLEQYKFQFPTISELLFPNIFSVRRFISAILSRFPHNVTDPFNLHKLQKQNVTFLIVHHNVVKH